MTRVFRATAAGQLPALLWRLPMRFPPLGRKRPQAEADQPCLIHGKEN